MESKYKEPVTIYKIQKNGKKKELLQLYRDCEQYESLFKRCTEGLSPEQISVEAREVVSPETYEFFLAAAKSNHSRVQGWFSKKTTSARRIAHCNICDCTIDTESNSDRPTKHFAQSIESHFQAHLKTLKGE